MSLSHDGYDFNAPLHDPIVTPDSPELQIVVSQFMGVEGESHLIGKKGGCDLFARVLFRDYSTPTLLKTDIDEVISKVGTLTGTLTETLNGNTRTFTHCTFLGLMEIPPPGGGQTGMFRDGSGVHGWIQYAILRWRKRQ